MTPLKNLLAQSELQMHALNAHPLYSRLKTLQDLQFFMERHVYAVFDFMSLVKTLQAQIAPCQTFWLPPQNRNLARFINEIVLAEESDQLPFGGYASHFEIYLMAMEEIGADTSVAKLFLKSAQEHHSWEMSSHLPPSAQNFLRSTRKLIESKHLPQIAAAFCFGREKIIPQMFQGLLDHLGVGEDKAPLFHFYLKRHIDLDGDQHGPLALQMMEYLCGENLKNWELASQATTQAISARLQFWDQIENELLSHTMKRIDARDDNQSDKSPKGQSPSHRQHHLR